MRRLIVDVDNVLWDAYPWTLEAVKQRFDKDITLEDVGHWFGWEPLLGKDWFDAFTIALDPARVQDREPLPDAPEVLYRLAKDFWIHFVSHNPRPKALYKPLYEWIEDNFYLDQEFNLTVFGARNCKVAYMEELGDCWGIIEDKPSTLRKASNKGYATFGRVTGLNAHEDIPRVNWFEEWDELYGIPSIIEDEVTA